MRRATFIRASFGALVVGFTGAASGCSLFRETVTLDLSGAEPAGLAPINGVNTSFFFAPEKLGNEEVWEAVREANLPAMRFPGGKGNSYDWRSGTANVAGRPEVINIAPMEEFMARAREAGLSVSYVLNINDSPRDILELARTWRRIGAPVQWVELGNEYYLPRQVGTIGGPDGYLERARTALGVLRAGGYDGPVGVPVHSPLRSYQSSVEGWNRTLAAEDAFGFDAVVLHYYPSLLARSLEDIYQTGPSELAAEVGRLGEVFPGKEVWVTEWNLGRPPNDPVINTLAHALFDLRMLKALADTPVPLACYHVLTGRGWELLGPDRIALDYENSEAQLIRRVPYFAFELIGEAASGGAGYMSPTRPAGDLEYMAFRTPEELRVVAWTTSGATYRIDKVKIEGASPRFTGGKVLQGDLDDTNGSLLSYDANGFLPGRQDSADGTWDEVVNPAPVGSPEVQGPGAALLRYSL